MTEPSASVLLNALQVIRAAKPETNVKVKRLLACDDAGMLPCGFSAVELPSTIARRPLPASSSPTSPRCFGNIQA